MIRKLISILMLGSTVAIAQPGFPPDIQPDSKKIFPYLVPVEYLKFHGDSSAWLLGHEIYIVLVYDLGESVRNVTNDDLQKLGLTSENARSIAIENLDRLASFGALGVKLFSGPRGKPFILVTGHWAAAASILLPVLVQSAAKRLNSEEVFISIPNRNALLIFPKGDKDYRDEMAAMIKEKESNEPKLLTFDLFEFNNNGIHVFDE